MALNGGLGKVQFASAWNRRETKTEEESPFLLAVRLVL